MRISPKREISLLILLLLILTVISSFALVFSLYHIRSIIKDLKEEQLYLLQPIIEKIVQGKEIKVPSVFDRITFKDFDSRPEFRGGVKVSGLITLQDGEIVKVNAYYQDPTSRTYILTILSLLLIITASVTASGVLYFRLYRTISLVKAKTKKETSILDAVSDGLTRIRAKEQEIEILVSVVAHEVRNSLGSIIATIQDPSIKKEVDHLNSFIKRLIEYTRLKETKKEVVSIPQLVEDVITDLDIPKGVKIQKSIQSIDHALDPLLFSSVLRNLIGNGIDACGEKGEIEIIAKKNQEGLLFEISDDGAGIPEEIVGHIFEAFFSTKEYGFGLGLAIVKRIVELHDGEITLSRSKGKKNFRIRIP